MTIASRTILSTVLISCLITPAIAADIPRKAPVEPAIVADRCAKVEPPKGTPEVPGGDIFGFTSPTDIGDPCSWGLAGELTGRAGKRDGSYLAVTKKTQLGYTYSDKLAFALSMFNTYNRWSNVTVAQDALAGAGSGIILTEWDKLQFDGLSGEVLFRLLARSPGQPFALTVSMEPRWSRVDGLTGYRAEGYGTEFKLFLDVALTERLFAAMNLNYALGTAKYDVPNAAWADASSTNFSLALTAQIHAAEKALVEGVFLGAEGRLLSSFTGLALNQNVGNALFAGPNLAIAFQGGRMLNLAWTPQVAGRAHPPSVPGAFELDNYERHQFRVKFAMPIK
jgi:hypothetical protein